MKYTTVEEVLRLRTEAIAQINNLTIGQNVLTAALNKVRSENVLANTLFSVLKNKDLAEKIPCTCAAIKDMNAICNAGNAASTYLGTEPQEQKIPRTGWTLTYSDCNCNRGKAVNSAECLLTDIKEILNGEPDH